MTLDSSGQGIPSHPVDELSRVGRELLRALMVDNVDLPTAMGVASPAAPASRQDRSRVVVLDALHDLVAWKLVEVVSYVGGDQLILSGSADEVIGQLSGGWERYSEPALVELVCTPRGYVALREYALPRAADWLATVLALGRLGQANLSNVEAEVISAASEVVDRAYECEFEAWKAT